MKLVVITGCLGLIGHHITRKCLKNGWKVLGIDKVTYAANKWALDEFKADSNFTFIKEDICNLKVLPDCDYVINTAAESHVGNSIIDSQDFIDSNISGVKNILDLIRQKPTNVCSRPVLMHFSTDEVYGDISKGSHTEESLLKPSNPYSASKAAADMLILAWARTYNLEYIILRPTNNYGVGQYSEKLIPLSVKLLQQNKKIRLHDEGKPKRTWLHSDDTAEAVLTIINSNIKNQIFNICGNYEEENREIVKKIIHCYFNDLEKYENHIDLSHKRPGQDIRYSVNDNKLKDLGWQPVKVFDKEISKIVLKCKENFRW
ncbi:GDP-mannose 4,6-dehydratase [bacterium]|jgi:dTDP-glucose 4,6-dehydratase|nr:GDP-mannose 4,6-dehydratase [bacterium]